MTISRPTCPAKAFPPAGSEVYKLECRACGKTVELPTHLVQNGIGRCPKCGAALQIDWGALAREMGGAQ